MLNAFLRHADGTIESTQSLHAVAEAARREGTVLWADLESPAEADLAALRDIFRFDADALEDCLHGEQRPRIDVFQDYVFIVLYGMMGAEENAAFEPRKLAIFFSSRYLISIHRQPLLTIRTLIDRATRDPRPLLSAGTDMLLYRMVDGMIDKYELLVDRYEERIEEFEDCSVDPAVDASLLEQTQEFRKELLVLRRLAVSQRELLTPLADGTFEDISDSLEQRFAHVRDHATRVIEETDGLRDRLHSVRENYHAALAMRTNVIMKTLTIFATILLPLSFIAGVYGMNLPLWPPPDDPASFWGVLGAMLVVVVALLIFFRRRGWI